MGSGESVFLCRIDRELTTSTFSWNSQWLRREINVRCERVYELLTYSILSRSRRRGRKSEWIDNNRSRAVDYVNDSRLRFPFLSKKKKKKNIASTIKTFYGVCVDASLYFPEHCTPRNTLYFIYIRIYVYTVVSYTPASVSNILKNSTVLPSIFRGRFARLFFMPASRFIIQIYKRTLRQSARYSNFSVTSTF